MTAILFDLDGTLLPMDMDVFTEGYFRLLAKKIAPLGYEPKKLVSAVWTGTHAMVKNDGSVPNSERFWKAFAQEFGSRVYDDAAVFDAFYLNEFKQAAVFTSPRPEKAQAALRAAREHAQRVILATNPIFPAVGVETRLSWLGLRLSDFDYVTTYENSAFCKPNPLYYGEILSKTGLEPRDCLMIGNDVDEDILASAGAGIKSYLVSDCVLNKSNSEHSAPSGSFDDMIGYISALS